MGRLKIRLLGGFELENGGGVLPLPATPKSRSLLAYLIVHRDRLIHRERICAALWPDETEAVARKALRAALWRIRCAIESHSTQAGKASCEPIYADGYQIGFRESPDVWVDLWEFEDAIASTEVKPDDALSDDDVEVMARATQLYRGDYAAGIHDDWLTVEQVRLLNANLALIERISALHARRQRWLQAIIWAERALAHDPLREHLHRAIMACHLSMGDRPSALRQYARCVEALSNDLGIAPMQETMALCESMVDPLEASPSPPPVKTFDDRSRRIDPCIAKVRKIIGRGKRDLASPATARVLVTS